MTKIADHFNEFIAPMTYQPLAPSAQERVEPPQDVKDTHCVMPDCLGLQCLLSEFCTRHQKDLDEAAAAWETAKLKTDQVSLYDLLEETDCD